MMRTVAVAFLFMIGCSSRERSWETPWPVEPASYEPPSPGQVQAPVREGRFPVDLPTVLKLAGANNLDIAFIREKAHEAHALADIAQERFWPQFGPALSFSHDEFGSIWGVPGPFISSNHQQMFAGGVATLQVQVGDAIFANLSAAQRYEGAKSRLEATEQAVLLEASVVYYELVRETLRAKVSELSVDISNRLATQLEVAVQAGRGFKGDVLRSQANALSSRLDVLGAKEAMKLASIRLASVLRLAPTIELYPAEDVPALLSLVNTAATPQELLAEAGKRRAEIREAMAEVEASGQDANGSAWGPLIPDVTAFAVPGEVGPRPSQLKSAGDFGVLVGWRLGPGGLLDFGRRDLADSKMMQAKINLERVRQKVSEELLSSLAQVRVQEEKRTIAEQEFKAAEQALRLNQERMTQGIGLPLEVLESERALAKARLDVYSGVVGYNQAQLRLYAALGRKH